MHTRRLRNSNRIGEPELSEAAAGSAQPSLALQWLWISDARAQQWHDVCREVANGVAAWCRDDVALAPEQRPQRRNDPDDPRPGRSVERVRFGPAIQSGR